MSTYIEIPKVCQFCGNEFTARTLTTRYCSHICNSRAYKAAKRAEKIDHVIKHPIKERPSNDLKDKEFLTVRDASILLGLSLRTTYRLIDQGILEAMNLGERLTRIRRSELDKLSNS